MPTADMLRGIGNSSQGSMADYPVLKDSPLYIQQSLLFPYTKGILFFDAVYKKIGKEAFAAVFRDSPADSAAIMHPDRYFAHAKAANPDLPKLALSERAKDLSPVAVEVAVSNPPPPSPRKRPGRRGTTTAACRP